MDEKKKEILIEMLIENSTPVQHKKRVQQEGVDGVVEGSSGRDDTARLKYHYALQRLITEYFDYDSMQVTVADLQPSVMLALTDLAGNLRIIEMLVKQEASESLDERDQEPLEKEFPIEKTIEDDGLVEVFSAKMNAIKRDWGKASLREYTIWFPWHVSWRNGPSMLEMYGHTFEPSDQSDWKPRLEQIADGPDVSGGRYILEEIEDGEYDVWETTISSRTPRWAMLRFENALEILSAQLSHSEYFLNTQTRPKRLGRMSGNTRDGGRWTAIQRPFGVFYVDDLVDEQPYTPHWGANVYDHSGRPAVSLDYSSLSYRLDTHLPFEDLRVGNEPLLHNVLVDYQQGLTETDHRRSFINFWRVIEELSLAEEGQKEVTVERALFALDVVTEDEYDAIFEHIAKEIWEVRNSRTHETGWIRIGTEHEVAAKVLADAMIWLYLTEFIDTDGDINQSKIRRVFDWATKPESTRKEAQEALNTVSHLFSER